MIAIDTETWLIRPGCLAPPIVCLTAYDGAESIILGPGDAIEDYVFDLLGDDDLIVGHNLAYDLAVLVAAFPGLSASIWAAMAAGRFRDTMIRAQLIAIALDRYEFDPITKGRPGWSLAALASRFLGVELLKEDTWRLRYSDLADLSVLDWPPAAREYALKDAEIAYRLFRVFDTDYGEPADEVLQVRAAWALHLMSCWGMTTDAGAVEVLRRETVQTARVLEDQLQGTGFLRTARKPNGRCSRNLGAIRAHVAAVWLDDPPKTPTGQIRTDRDTLRLCDDPGLRGLAQYGEIEKALGFITGLQPLVQPRFTVLVRSGRTSSSRPNIQQVPRKGGVRECFVPRPGWRYVSADYSSVELCALSEVCHELFGYSEMGKAIALGQDLHVKTGAMILDMRYDDAAALYAKRNGSPRLPIDIQAVVDARQLAKAVNFGFPGGLSAETFVAYARSSWGVEIKEEEARDLKTQWLLLYPEIRAFFEYVGSQGPNHTVKQLRSGRLRGGLSFCNGCNTWFQGLAADMAKAALWEVSRACYAPAGPLSGCRPVAFIHDEILMEAPAEQANAAAAALVEVMETAGKRWIKTVPITVEATVMERWSK